MKNSNKSESESIFSTLGLALSFITAVSPIFVNSKIAELFIDQKVVNPSSFAALIFGVLIAWVCINFFPYITIQIPSFNKAKTRNLYQKHVVLILLLISFGAFILFFSTTNSLVQAASYIIFFDLIIAGFSLVISNARATEDYSYQQENLPYKTVGLLEKNGVISTDIKIEINSPIGDDVLHTLGINHFGGARYVRVSDDKTTVKDAIITYDASELLYVITSEDHEALKKNGINIGQI